jgi:ABC-type nitrate/sulfonate/bicarbonate transport system permease component
MTAEALRRIALGAVGLIAFISVWWLVSTAMDPLQLPAPDAVASAAVPLLFHSDALATQFGSGNGGILPHLLISLLRLLLGTTLGVALGVAIGLAMTYERRVAWLLDLPTRILRAVPPLAVIPFVLVWFGTSAVSQVFVVALYILLLVLVSTTNAVANVRPVHARFAQTMGATKAQTYRQVVLPAILPELIGGLRVALAFAWGLLVVAELVGGNHGIGRVLSLLVPLLQTPDLIAAILWIVLVAVLVDWLFMRVERYLLRWHHA